MIGMTPPVFTRRGRYVFWPPKTLRPTTRLAYWTGMRRCARSTKTMAATTAAMKTRRKIAVNRLMEPRRIWSIEFRTAVGRFATMPAKMMSEMPLPTPRSVICSPSHMTNAVPVVRVRTAIRMNPSLPESDAGSRTAR